jgi:hypothetical protein
MIKTQSVKNTFKMILVLSDIASLMTASVEQEIAACGRENDQEIQTEQAEDYFENFRVRLLWLMSQNLVGMLD